jgi:hypothetical protein
MARPALCWLMTLVLLVPMLFAIMPSSVSAEEAALYRDMQKSRCLAQGLPMQDEQHDCDHCVLTAPAALPRFSFAAAPFVAFAPATQSAKVSFVFEALSRARLAAMTTPDPGRGPPV